MKTPARLLFVSLLALLVSASTASAQDNEQAFSQAELDQMLAPIALYPDSLLSQILTAATYPLDVVKAARWSRDHPDLEGERAVNAVADEDWAPSVKALAAFPRVLENMDADLDWTTRLGDAFLYQEAQVMDTIQGLRQRAYAAGNLNSTGNLEVIREREVIVIEPAHPRIVYVPYYNPRVVYGAWWWPAHPPVYWAPSSGIIIHTGFFFGSGVHVSLGFFFSTFDWHRHHIVVVHRHQVLHGVPKHKLRAHVKHHGHKWRPKAKHRRGIAFGHHSLDKKHDRLRATGFDHRRKSHGHRLHEARRPHPKRDQIKRGHRKQFFAGPSDHRRSGGHGPGNKRKRTYVDLSRSVIASGIEARARGEREAGSRRHGIRTPSVVREHVARGAREAKRRHRGARRADGGIGISRDVRRSQFQSRRSDARRAIGHGRRAAQRLRRAETRGFSGRFKSKFGNVNRGMKLRQRGTRSRFSGP